MGGNKLALIFQSFQKPTLRMPGSRQRISDNEGYYQIYSHSRKQENRQRKFSGKPSAQICCQLGTRKRDNTCLIFMWRLQRREGEYNKDTTETKMDAEEHTFFFLLPTPETSHQLGLTVCYDARSFLSSGLGRPVLPL